VPIRILGGRSHNFTSERSSFRRRTGGSRTSSSEPGAAAGLATVRDRLRPLAAELVDRARAAGRLRADCEPEDLGIVHLMLSAVIDAGQDVEPELWRRYLAMLLRGLKAEPTPPEPLPVPAVSPTQMDEVLAGAWNAPRS
jgi:hypothetical protein